MLPRSIKVSVGIKWMLERRAHHYAFIIFKNIYRSIAVVDIEINDGDAFKTVMFNRM